MGICKHKSVVGLGYGDEGKGIVTDYLCSKSRNPLVIRFSGGQQAGHTVCTGDKRHVFANFGSGTLRGIPTYWRANTCDPIGILNEYDILKEKFGITPKLFINENCPITTTFDLKANQLSVSDNKHGTCGFGFGKTLQREEDHYHLQAKDLFNPTILRMKLIAISKYYLEFLKETDDFWSFNNRRINKFMEVCEVVLKKVSIIDNMYNIANEYDIDSFVYEGSQGLMLDKDIGVFPNVTRSNVGLKGLSKLGINSMDIYLVTRAYSTRHGNGPFEENSKIPSFSDETNITNEYQGRFRKGYLNIELLNHVLKEDVLKYCGTTNLITLVVTCLDHVEGNWKLIIDGETKKYQSESEFLNELTRSLNLKGIAGLRLKTIRSPLTEDVE